MGTKCKSYAESKIESNERQGLTLGFRLTEVSVKRESTVLISFRFYRKKGKLKSDSEATRENFKI